VAIGGTQQELAPLEPPAPAAASATTTTTAAADSSDVEKKIQEKFIKEMSKVIVKILNPYRSPGVKGHISSTEDFKHLAKKVALQNPSTLELFCINLTGLEMNCVYKEICSTGNINVAYELNIIRI
jgi:hypothetical protein